MMEKVFINPEFTVAVSGHRKVEKDLDEDRLKEIFIKLINSGVDTFLIGMAVGFDTLCFQILEKIKEEYNIRIIACIPCKGQSSKFSFEQKKEYERMLNVCDEKVLVSEEYTPYCMFKRNRFMVDNSKILVCYLRQTKGGTFNTWNYAKNNNKLIVKV